MWRSLSVSWVQEPFSYKLWNDVDTTVSLQIFLAFHFRDVIFGCYDHSNMDDVAFPPSSIWKALVGKNRDSNPEPSLAVKKTALTTTPPCNSSTIHECKFTNKKTPGTMQIKYMAPSAKKSRKVVGRHECKDGGIYMDSQQMIIYIYTR